MHAAEPLLQRPAASLQVQQPHPSGLRRRPAAFSGCLAAHLHLLGLPVHFSVPPEPFPVVFSSPVHACMQAANGGSPQLVGNRELLACSSRFHSQLQKLPVPWHWHGFFPNLKLSY